jgi:hypothetical protein
MSDAPLSPQSNERAEFDIGTCIRDALASAWDAFPLWFVALLVMAVCVAVAAVTVIGVLLVVPVLVWGWTEFLLGVQDRRASLGDLFSGFSRYGDVLGPTLGLIGLFLVLGMLGNAVSSIGQWRGHSSTLVVGGLLNIAWTLFILPRFYFAYFYLVERRMGAVESFRASWDRTGPMAGRCTLLLLAGLAVGLVLAIPAGVILGVGLSGRGVVAGALGFGILIPPAVVIPYLMWTSAWRQLEGGGPA